MIDERYLCRGKRIDNGEWVTGIFCRNSEGKNYIIDDKSIYSSMNFNKPILICDRFFEIDPATIEPVAVELLNLKVVSPSKKYFAYYCPNCKTYIGNDQYGEIRNYDCRTIDEYCVNCGQRFSGEAGESE